MSMISRISHEQISDDALAALGEANLDDLEFGLDVERETIFCANFDERMAWIWNRETVTWDDYEFATYCIRYEDCEDEDEGEEEEEDEYEGPTSGEEDGPE